MKISRWSRQKLNDSGKSTVTRQSTTAQVGTTSRRSCQSWQVRHLASATTSSMNRYGSYCYARCVRVAYLESLSKTHCQNEGMAKNVIREPRQCSNSYLMISAPTLTSVSNSHQ
ncbi:protein of unknown function [Burkholderia multivorans]